jgi:hypothetical protein
MSSNNLIPNDGTGPQLQLGENEGEADNQVLTDPWPTPAPAGADTDALQDTLQRLAVALASIGAPFRQH